MLALSSVLLLITGCTNTAKQEPAPAAAAAARVTVADIDRLTGPQWNGTLTYKDYKSGKPTIIKSSLLVARQAGAGVGDPAWEMKVGYADEPHANSGEKAVLSDGGRLFREETVLEREMLADGTVRFVTEQGGEDDNRPAKMRFVYLVGAKECSIQKLVRFTDGGAGRGEFFERHVYRWSR